MEQISRLNHFPSIAFPSPSQVCQEVEEDAGHVWVRVNFEIPTTRVTFFHVQKKGGKNKDFLNKKSVVESISGGMPENYRVFCTSTSKETRKRRKKRFILGEKKPLLLSYVVSVASDAKRDRERRKKIKDVRNAGTRGMFAHFKNMQKLFFPFFCSLRAFQEWVQPHMGKGRRGVMRGVKHHHLSSQYSLRVPPQKIASKPPRNFDFLTSFPPPPLLPPLESYHEDAHVWVQRRHRSRWTVMMMMKCSPWVFLRNQGSRHH